MYSFFNDHTAATPQQQDNPYSNSYTYNPGWRDHSSLIWEQNQNYHSSPNTSTFHPWQSWQQNHDFLQQHAPSTPPPPPPTQPQGGPSLAELIRQMETNNLQFQKTTKSAIQSLQTYMGQLATMINQNQLQSSSNLPSQTISNPNSNREDVSVIPLRSGNQTVVVKSVEPEKTSSEEVRGKGEDVGGDDKVKFSSFDVMQYPVDDIIDDMHNYLLSKPSHDKHNECEFSCFDCTGKTELCATCQEIAEFLNKEHDDVVDFNVEHDLPVVCSEIALSLKDSKSFDSIGCDTAILEECLQVAGPPSIQQQLPPTLKYAFEFNEDCNKTFDQPKPKPKQHLTFGPTLQPLHWEFPFELIWMLWLQKFKTKIKDRCGAKRKLQLLEELQMNSQRIKLYHEGYSKPTDEQDILLTDGKYPP